MLLFRKNVVFLQPHSARAEQMVGVAQLVRVPDCGSEGRGFESHLPPRSKRGLKEPLFLLANQMNCWKLCTFAPHFVEHGKDNGYRLGT